MSDSVEPSTPPPIPVPEPAPEPEVKPFYAADADFPKGFWHSVDYLLQHPELVLNSIVHEHDLWRLKGTFLVVTIAMGMIYGVVMGATNLLQGTEMALFGKFAMMPITAIKVTTLLLLTLVIVIPPIYVSNSFVGSRFSFKQLVVLLLAGCAVTSTVLASMATVAFFFALTSTSYYFIKLLHVLFFAYAGFMGLRFVLATFSAVAKATGKRLDYSLLIMWIVLYAFVGTQLAWVMRPFIGRSDMPVTLFRPREGNFYENLLDSADKMMTGAQQQKGKRANPARND